MNPAATWTIAIRSMRKHIRQTTMLHACLEINHPRVGDVVASVCHMRTRKPSERYRLGPWVLAIVRQEFVGQSFITLPAKIEAGARLAIPGWRAVTRARRHRDGL